MKSQITDHKSRMAFTLIELLVVIAIIALLAATIRPMLSVSASKTREFACASNLKQIALGLRAYVEDNGSFPPGLVSLDPILQDKTLMSCPVTDREYWYHRPAKDIGRDAIVAACVRPETRKGRRPHRYGDCTLVLSAGGSVERVVNE